MNRPDPIYPDAKSGTSFQDGLEFQDFVCEQLAKQSIVLQNLTSRRYQFELGENLQGFEIKFDSLCTKTGRLSIEVAEKSRDDESLVWTPSGIMRNDNTWLYIQGNYEIIFIFAKSLLVNVLEKKGVEVIAKRGTIKTFYVANDWARRWAAKVIEFEVKNQEECSGMPEDYWASLTDEE